MIASLRRFWLLESSELFESACLELAEPKQPIADQGAHQQADDVPPSGDVSGDSVVPRASPLRASININFQCSFPPSHLSRSREGKKCDVLLLFNVYVAFLSARCTFICFTLKLTRRLQAAFGITTSGDREFLPLLNHFLILEFFEAFLC